MLQTPAPIRISTFHRNGTLIVSLHLVHNCLYHSYIKNTGQQYWVTRYPPRTQVRRYTISTRLPTTHDAGEQITDLGLTHREESFQSVMARIPDLATRWLGRFRVCPALSMAMHGRSSGQSFFQHYARWLQNCLRSNRLFARFPVQRGTQQP